MILICAYPSLSFIQLLISLKKSLNKQKKKLILNFTFTPELIKIIENNGFYDITKIEYE